MERYCVYRYMYLLMELREDKQNDADIFLLSQTRVSD